MFRFPGKPGRAAASMILLALLLRPHGEALAQTTLVGQVSDASTREPLVGANVVVEGTTTGTTTDARGRFDLRWEGALPVTLRISFLGFATAEVRVESAAPGLEVALEPRTLSQGAVVVSASRRSEKVTAAPAAISVLYARELEGQTLTSPVEALRNVVGLDVSEQGVNTYTVTLRGRNLAFDTATHVLIDNRQATTPGLSVTVFGRQPLNPDDIDRIEVIRGPGSALYGPGVDAGVIHFITKNPFDHPGTDVSVAGGTRSSLRMNAVHRGVAGAHLGYKVNLLYGRANNWEYDADDPDDAAFLDVFPTEILSGIDGRHYATIDGIDPTTDNYGATGSVEYRFSERTSVFADAGYSRFKGINRFTLGEVFNDFPEVYGQIRLASGDLFAQAFYLNAANDEKTFLYRTGRTLAFNNRQYEVQAQYGVDVPRFRTQLTMGGEYQTVTTDTRGTINGMFESDDATTIFGAYAQSQSELAPELSLTLAGRLDRFHTIEQTVFSPRAGLVWHPAPAHSVRLTFNRAYASPTNLSLFTDLVVARFDPLDIRLVGGAVPITFDDPRRTVSLIPGVGAYEGFGLPLPVAWPIAVGALAGSFPAPVAEALLQKAPSITGFSAGVPYDIDEGIVSVPRERDYLLRPQKTDMAELGWTGVFDRLYVSASAYWTRKRDFESDIRLFGPLVVALNLGNDLAAAVDGAFTDAELTALGLDRATLTSAFRDAGERIAADPIGVLHPDQLQGVTTPTVVATFVNFGAIDYGGLELTATWLPTERLSITANYTRLSKIDFDEEDLGVPGSGERYALNLPQNAFGLKGDWSEGATGVSASLAYRYKQAFEGDFGDLFAGTVGRQSVVDAAVGYALRGGLRLNLTAQNVLDTKYRSFVGLPKIGRLVLLSARFSF